MKQFLAGLVLIAGLSLHAAPQDGPPVKPKLPAGQDQLPPAIRFNPMARTVAGAAGDVLAVSVSVDGKRIAAVGGGNNPVSGFLSVVEIGSQKELLLLRLPRPYQSVGISPDGKLAALTGQSGDLKLVEIASGKILFSKKLDASAQVAFAPDGQTMATVTQAKTVQLWDVPSGEEQSKFRSATLPLRSLAFSPDGRKLAAAGSQPQTKGTEASGSVYVWDIVSQRLLHKLEIAEPSFAAPVAFSPDGKTLATTSQNTRIQIWDLASEKVKTTIEPQVPLFGLAFAPGRNLAAGMADGTIRTYNPASGEELAVIGRHAGGCRCLALLDDGKKLVSGGNGRSLKLWDVAAKKELAVLHEDERIDEQPIPLALAAAPSGSLIALATEDKGIIVRDGRGGDIKATLKGHEDAVTCVAISPDGKTLASGSADKTIKLWDLANFKERATLQGHTNWVYALNFSHDGKTLASGAYDKSIKFWDVESGADKGTIEAHRGSVRAVAFSPDDKTIASGGSDRFVKLWNVADRQMTTSIKAHQSTVRCLAFSSDGKVLASGGEDSTVRLWNSETGKERVATKTAHSEEVTTLVFAGERTLLSGGSDGGIFQWDALTGEMIGALQGHNGGVSGLVVIAGSTEFLSTGADRAIKRFHRDIPPVRLFAGHTGVVQCMSFSPDGKRFASCGNWPEGDKTLRIWDVQKGTEVLKIDLPAQASMVVYSPDGKYLASTSGNFNAYLWDAQTGAQVRIFKGHTSGVGGLDISADGTKLLTSSTDKTVRVWETATGRELKKFTSHNDMVRRTFFHPDGQHALSAGRDGYVRMWDLDTAEEVKKFKAPGQWADCMAVSRDGKFLAIGATNSAVFDIETEKTVATLEGSVATDLAFSADSKRVISSGYDGTSRLWDRESGKELYRIRANREFLWMSAVSPDGKWLLTGGGGLGAGNGKYDKGSDHTVRLWKMPDEQAISQFSSEN